MELKKNAVSQLPPAFIALAADVFGVEAGELRPDTAYGSFPAWDSIAHLRLVMETEAKFGCSIPLEAVPAIKTLADFLPYLSGSVAKGQVFGV